MNDEILKYIEEEGLLLNPRIINEVSNENYKNTEFKFIIEGEIEINNITLQVACDKFFPIHKPHCFIKSLNSLKMIPHVDKDGEVCYVEDEGLLIDISSETLVIRDTILRVLKTITEGIQGVNNADFINEFETYWIYQKNIMFAESIIGLTNDVKEISVGFFKDYRRFFFGDSTEAIIKYCNKYIKDTLSNRPIFEKATYIPIRPGTYIFPPNYEAMWNNKFIRNNIINNITASNKGLLQILLKDKLHVGSRIYYVLSIPKPNGTNILIGLEYSGFKKNQCSKNQLVANPLKSVECEFNIRPIYIERHDKGLLAPRGGASNNIDGKKVAIIGCGAVGGYISMELIKAGVNQMTLIDDDILSQNNVYRHTLGVNSILKKANRRYKSQYKVNALKREIENKLPFSQIDTITMKIEDILEEKRVDFTKYDLVIMAIGNPTIELYINKYFHEISNMPPLIITWLEPYGIGGHAFLSNNKNKGCFQCLFNSPMNDTNEIFNRSSFAESGQTFTKAVSGCGSLFTPYSSLDAIQTAILATRLSVNVLQEKEEDNPLLSWKGDAQLYLENGYILSQRYKLTNEMIYNLRYKYKAENCCVCSRGENND